jgi:hypothetical protein
MARSHKGRKNKMKPSSLTKSAKTILIAGISLLALVLATTSPAQLVTKVNPYITTAIPDPQTQVLTIQGANFPLDKGIPTVVLASTPLTVAPNFTATVIHAALANVAPGTYVLKVSFGGETLNSIDVTVAPVATVAPVGLTGTKEDFITIRGKQYTNVIVTRVEPDGIVVEGKKGISKLYFSELSEEVQERFHYDPEGAAEYVDQRAAQEDFYNNQQEEIRLQKEKQYGRSFMTATQLEAQNQNAQTAWDQDFAQRQSRDFLEAARLQTLRDIEMARNRRPYIYPYRRR